MILDWSIVVLLLGTLAASVVVLRPFVIGRTMDKTRAVALEDINKRLVAVEAHLVAGGRRMPGALR